MRGNWINATHNGTGGSGTLTLVAITGWPNFDKVFTGVRYVTYEINEFTDSTKTVLSKSESGTGSIDTATLILTRTKIGATWDGTTYLPNPGSATAPTALSFGNTAANISVICGPAAESTSNTIPFNCSVTNNAIDVVGLCGQNVVAGAGNNNLIVTTGEVYYWSINIQHRGPFSQASVRVGTTAATTGAPAPTVTVAIYEIGSNGLPGKKLIDFGTVGNPTTTNTILQNTALATPIDLPPGWYYCALLYLVKSGSGAPGLASVLHTGALGVMMSGNVSKVGYMMVKTGQTALNDPATAPDDSQAFTSNGSFSWLVTFT